VFLYSVKYAVDKCSDFKSLEENSIATPILEQELWGGCGARGFPRREAWRYAGRGNDVTEGMMLWGAEGVSQLFN